MVDEMLLFIKFIMNFLKNDLKQIFIWCDVFGRESNVWKKGRFIWKLKFIQVMF